MDRSSGQHATVLTLFNENLICARGALGEFDKAAFEAPDDFDADEVAQVRALWHRCREGETTDRVALTEADARLLSRAIDLTETRWSMSDREVMFGIKSSDRDLAVTLVEGVID